VKSCIYRGVVRHRRRSPVEHAFEYPLFMMYLDLGELPELFDSHWLWSARGPAPAWFRRSDYLGSAEVDLAVAVRDEAERLTGHRPAGDIRMLTHLRYFGYVQNPVTFYYCFRPGGDEVDTILAEITNTPWGERHTYALRSHDSSATCGRSHRFEKSFHVSPFMEMEQRYEWRFSEPGPNLRVHMRNTMGTDKVFDATLALGREEITSASLARALARFPWMTARVVAGIYWQAFVLWAKRVPYQEHPERRAA
jgi:DUF1365 family protein